MKPPRPSKVKQTTRSLFITVIEHKAKITLVPDLGTSYISVVQVIAKRALVQFWARHPNAETPLRAWHGIAAKARWNSPADIKAAFRSADFVGDNRVIFNVGGNNYRLVVHIAYAPYYRMLIKFVGTHTDYDDIDPGTV